MGKYSDLSFRADLTSFDYYIFIISQLWLTSHPRSTVVLDLLDTGHPGTSREIVNKDANCETLTRNP